MADEYVTRRELDLMKASADVEHAELRARMDSLDEHGSRGVGALQVRMDVMVSSMAEMKADVAARFDAHEREHEREESKRVTGRRWMVGSIIAAVASVDGPLVTILLARR